MAETSTIFGFMKYVSATDILSDFKKTVDSHFVNSLRPNSYELDLFSIYHERSTLILYSLYALNLLVNHLVQ